MAAVTTTGPEVTYFDRLSLTFCLAVILHGIIILGVTFTPEDKQQPRYDTMEIILVQQRSQEEPEDAKILAQANLEGGGDATEDTNSATPNPAPFPEQTLKITAPLPVEEAPPPESTLELVNELAKIESQAVRETLIAEMKTTEITPPEEITRPESESVLVRKGEATTDEEQIKTMLMSEKNRQRTSEKPRRRHPTATALLTNSFKIASLSAEIRRKMQTKDTRPRRKFISSNTKESRYALYMEGWRAKVERIGNLNYPDQARRQKLSGSLILDVALNPDGSINQITVRASSGHKVLDAAAVHIVELASPFAPFPDNIRGDTDVLHITRTWEFLNNQGFR